MSTVVLFIKIIAILFCTGCLLTSLKKIYKGNCAIQYLGYLIVYFFFVFPVLFQIFFPYEYVGFYMANDALKDGLAYTLYCIFISTLSYFMVYYKQKATGVVNNKIVCNSLLTKVCFIVIVLTFLYTLLVNGIGIIFAGYGARLSNDSYRINEAFISCSLLCYLVLFGQFKKIKKRYIISSTIIIAVLFWIHGKRFILAEFLILTIFVLFVTGIVKGRHFIYLLVFGGVLVLVFSYAYGVFFKQNANSLVEYFSIDLSRHYTLIYQFYCSINGKQISVNQFDAITEILLFWVPRSFWPNKPYPFSNAITISLLGGSVSNINLGWSTTVSIFCDLFDSFSYLGLILGIALILLVCKKINRTAKLHYKVLGIYFLINLLVVQLVASLTCIFLCLILFIACDYLGSKKSYNVLEKLNRGQIKSHVVIERR